MGIYLQDIPLSEAKARLRMGLIRLNRTGILGKEEIALDEAALGRVLAEPVWARQSSPHYHASAMDGFAVRANDLTGAQPGHPRQLEMGSQAIYVDTGDPLPAGMDAVIPIEDTQPVYADAQPADPRHPQAILIRAALPPWSHVRALGEDIVATELVLPAGHTLRPIDLGALAASGASHITVCRKPRVAILPTGSELVEVGKAAQAGEIIEYNALMLAAQVMEWGGIAIRYPITPDDEPLIAARVQQAAEEADLVLLNAGSSAGSEDYSARVIAQLGEVWVHGVAVRPGHPVILGMLRRAIGEGAALVIGVPGYPVSAALTGEIFVKPLLHGWLGRAAGEDQTAQAALTRKITSPAGDDDYVRVVVGRVGSRLLAAPLSRGAGVITSLVRADGLVILPRGVQGVEAGAQVRVHLLRPAAEMERTLFAIGSHDLTLDLLAQYLANPADATRARRLVSANVGSLGGLAALRKGEAHLAGCHWLDPATGEYNLQAVRTYLPDTAVQIMAWVGRVQGLMLPAGNPRGIHGLADLADGEVRFINRQPAAGTRALLDYHLQKLGIPPESIRGYDQEEFTHLAVAAAVASGRADCGLGIAAAARSQGLDFIPLFTERYDLIIPGEYANNDLLAPLYEVSQNADFRKAVQSLDGYDVARMGEIVLQC